MGKTRRKTEASAPVGIATQDEFEQNLNEIARLGVLLEQEEAACERECLEVASRYEQTTGDLKKRIGLLMKACESYAATRRGELFGDRKSSETLMAVYGYRWGKPALQTLPGWTFDRVLELLDRSRRRAYIVTKRTLNKDALRQHVRPEVLASLGLCITQKETFFVDRKKIVPSPVKE